jgi:hypothetical protein
MFSVPIYFQVTAGMSNTEAGMHLVPAVVGNAVGGLLSGLIIKRCATKVALFQLSGVYKLTIPVPQVGEIQTTCRPLGNVRVIELSFDDASMAREY